MANDNDKPKTAAEGNAPGGQAFQDEAHASGANAQLGGQVKPETQLREDDGNRTLAKPVPDPGPVGTKFKHPDTSKGETIGDVNKPVKIMRRHDTTREGDVRKTDMAPDLIAHHGASDIYNKEQGEGLTDMAVKHAADAREIAPQSTTD